MTPFRQNGADGLPVSTGAYVYVWSSCVFCGKKMKTTADRPMCRPCRGDVCRFPEPPCSADGCLNGRLKKSSVCSAHRWKAQKSNYVDKRKPDRVAKVCPFCGISFEGKKPQVACGAVECLEERKRQATKDVSHRRRARKRGAKVGRVVRAEVLARDDYVCHLCGQETLPGEGQHHPRYPTLDHLIPLSRGGEHSMENVATACFRCNTRRSNKLLSELPPGMFDCELVES